MRHRKVFFIISLVIFLIWIGLYVRMKLLVKEPMEEVFFQGDIIKYYGLEIIPESIEVYNAEEFEKEYGKTDALSSDQTKDRYVVVNLHVINTSGQDVKLKNGISTWNMEINHYSNGQSATLMDLNQVKPYEKDADVSLKLFYRFVDGKNYDGGEEDIKKSSIRVYFSYYPELRYIQCQ